jgi:MoxR-like ATPase
MADLQSVVHDILTFIQDRLYFNRADLEVKGQKHNAALLFSTLTGLVGGKILIVGEPGLGKTTSAEYIGALLYRMPLGAVWEAEVSGHPEQTEEKIVGRPNLGALNRGEEDVVWSAFSVLPVKVVDEINRLPETKQSLILNGVDRGNWSYLNQMQINSEYCLFATANYQDRGTNTIVAPLLDRFDVMVESKHPGANLSWMIGTEASPAHLLRDPEREQALQACLIDQDYGAEVEAICSAYGDAITERLSVPTLGRREREAIRNEMNALPFDTDASAFVRTFLAELSFCCKYGQKRTNEVCGDGCHYTGYLCYEVQTCPSNRLPMSIRRYAQALAWVSGDREVDLEHIRVVLPYACAHRIQWRDEGEMQDRRDDVLPVHRAREAVRQVLRRYTEQSDRIQSALITANRIVDGADAQPVQGEHPIYMEIMRDLGQEPARPEFS